VYQKLWSQGYLTFETSYAYTAQFFDLDKLSKSDTLTNAYPRERKLGIISGSAFAVSGAFGPPCI
jgi:hypothetical protein